MLYFKDFSSGAMIESIVRRPRSSPSSASSAAARRVSQTDDLLEAIREEFKENEDLPNTSNPDDWAKIAGKKGERIVYIKPIIASTPDKPQPIDRVVTTGQYL